MSESRSDEHAKHGDGTIPGTLTGKDELAKRTTAEHDRAKPYRYHPEEIPEMR